MLIGDRAKYLGLIFGIMFSTFLMSQQISLFIGILARTANQITNVSEADIWVMDPRIRYIDEIEPMPDVDLLRVKSVEGVKWAVPFFKGNAVIRSPDSSMQQVIILGIDDASFVGRPLKMLYGHIEDLNQPDAMIMDKSGYEYIWPNEPIQVDRTVEINDRRVKLVGFCEASPPFLTFPIVYTKYTQALNLAARERKKMSFILVKADANQSPNTIATRIQNQTGLQALTTEQFKDRSINHYLTRTGIPINFGITVALGFIVGAAIAAQTFYIFVIENLRQFGALKAIGVANRQIVMMVLLQALIVTYVGFGLGIGLCSLFFYGTKDINALREINLLWQVVVGTGATVIIISLVSSLASIRKVLVIDPAIVFRG